jgi:predicted NBD/HSP70 family sugar kinase
MCYVGLDLGGSKAALCCVDDAGTYHEQVIAVTAERTADAVLADIVRTLQRFIRSHGPLQRIAIASAPEMNAAGIITRWPSRPQWTGTPLATTLSQLLACEVVWCDDGTAAASADAAALAVDNLVHFSLGTGVGGGIVVDGEVLPDRELGHLVVYPQGEPCSCGRRGCLQAYASANALARDAPDTAVKEAEWSRRAAAAIALCSANLVELFRPAAISLSGGLLGRFPLFPDLVAGCLADNCIKQSLSLPRVVASPHGTRASLAGAVAYAQMESAHRAPCRSTMDRTA